MTLLRIWNKSILRNPISKRINKINPISKLKKEKEYKDEIFMLKLDEGGEFKNAKVKYFSGSEELENINDDLGPPITFYVKVVGFSDRFAPLRNWGVGIKSFIRKHLRKNKYKKGK